MITLTPLTPRAGTADGPLLDPSAYAASSAPISYLLELDDARILLDLGGYEASTESSSACRSYAARIRALAPTIDLVLLSHSPAAYLSLYPYARARWGLSCPVYATQPTIEMGRVVCLEESLQWSSEVPSPTENDGDPDLVGPFICSADEINDAFNHVKSIRYSQPVHLGLGSVGGPLADLLLTPYASGHSLGGSLFKLRSPTSGTVLYAVGLNHAPERHLDATVLLGSGAVADSLLRPELLIVEGGRTAVKLPKQKDRARELLGLVTSTLRAGNSLLFPVDASPRLLELLVLLDQHWSYSQQQHGSAWSFPLCLVGRTAPETVAFARSLMEWVGGSVMSGAGGGGGADGEAAAGRKRRRGAGGGGDDDRGPFAFRHLRMFATPDELAKAIPASSPKLVLAVPLSMDYGPSRRLFASHIAASEGNVVVLTNGAPETSLARELYDTWAIKQGATSVGYGQPDVGVATTLGGTRRTIRLRAKVPLEGDELERHLEQERQAKERAQQLAAAQAAAENRSRRLLEADDLEESDDESDGEQEGGDGEDSDRSGRAVEDEVRGGGGGGGGGAFLEADDDARATSFDIYVKGQQTKAASFGAAARFRMFPYVERAGGRGRRVDAYGEQLDVGAWLRKGKEIEEETETEEVKEAKRKQREEEERKKQPPEPPSKYIEEALDVQLDCRIMWIDMEGLCDGRAIKTLIPRLNPRRAIIVRSSRDAADDLLLTSPAAETYAPECGEAVTIGETMQSHPIALGEALLARKWARFEDYEVARIGGIVSARPGAPAVLDVGRELEQHSAAGGPLAQLGAGPLPRSLLIGDLRLIALKQALADREIPADFAGEGVLVCGKRADKGGLVAVRKSGEGAIELEGPVSEVYYRVREVMYGKLAHVLL